MSNCETFKVLTFNCNGINDQKINKYINVFEYFRQQKSSIIFLLETPLKFEAERFIRSGWGFECFLSGTETNKNGVAVLFNNTFEHKVLKVVRDPSGCFILMDVEIIRTHYACKCIWPK